ncbi:MucBP domain-containing protein [Bombilactobacillus folatiphilus]|uniref:MucBP domain-containing protein n=1 Tax=Bombilactobacillus folatiphilus TaxID=2923362 RepID=A0ABY4P8G7_9LACO|nr:MucBP domain-containing protein [Bombilactobacillus folatiphilus]UQS81900.1 MucBP domain-containing protein [Bombilactobacillus folatiphilus]
MDKYPGVNLVSEMGSGAPAVDAAHSFRPMFTDQTQVSYGSDDPNVNYQVEQATLFQHPSSDYVVFRAPLNDVIQSWAKYTNVGFYQGKNVDVKVDVAQQQPVKTKFGLIDLGIDTNSFLVCGSNSGSSNDDYTISVDIHFLDHATQKPLILSGYWFFLEINELKIVTVNTPIQKLITMTPAKNHLSFHDQIFQGTDPSGTGPTSSGLTLTYDRVSDFSYSFGPNPKTPNGGGTVDYTQDSFSNIQAPPPAIKGLPVANAYQDSSLYEINQTVPYENVRGYFTGWKVSLPIDPLIIVNPSLTTVTDTNGTNVTKNFDIQLVNNQLGVTAKSSVLSQATFYNRLYRIHVNGHLVPDSSKWLPKMNEQNVIEVAGTPTEFDKMNTDSWSQSTGNTDSVQFEAPTGQVTVKYVDKNQQAIAPDKVTTGVIDTAYQTSPKTVI